MDLSRALRNPPEIIYSRGYSWLRACEYARHHRLSPGTVYNAISSGRYLSIRKGSKSYVLFDKIKRRKKDNRAITRKGRVK